MALITAKIGAKVILVWIPQPNTEISLLLTNSTYAAASAFEVALRVFWPKSFNLKVKLKLSLIPFTKAEMGPLPSLVIFTFLFLHSISAEIISRPEPLLDAFDSKEINLKGLSKRKFSVKIDQKLVISWE